MLAPKFDGPYWITDALGPNTYRLLGEGGQVEEVVAAEQLKPCHLESPEEIEAGEGIAPVEGARWKKEFIPSLRPRTSHPLIPRQGPFSKEGAEGRQGFAWRSPSRPSRNRWHC